jgi:hydroxymethylpyrimidine/phosphomethylpyrimidine kinase
VYALAKNKNIKEALEFAKQITFNSIKNSRKVGNGIVITRIDKQDQIKIELSNAINKFTKIKNIYKNIPECQTNFVYAQPKPKSTKEVLGISGRIVKAEKEVIVAGDLSYGGSKHVATALLAVNKKFPKIHSAINLKYQEKTISKIKKLKLKFIEIEEAIKRNQSIIKENNNKINSLENEIERLTFDITKLEKTIADNECTIKEKNNTVNNLEKEIKSLRLQIIDQEKMIENKIDYIKKCEYKLDDADKRIKELKNKISD